MFFALPILCFSQFNGVWSPVRSWNTSYDSIGLIEERIELDHTIYSEGVADLRHQYQNNENGDIVEEKEQYWQIDHWQDLNRSLFYYNSDNQIDTSLYSYWSVLRLNWRTWSRSLATYSDQGDITTKVWESRFGNDSNWTATSRYTYSYLDSNLSLELNEIQSNGEWLNDDQWLYSYDSLGRLSQRLWQEYGNGNWFTRQRSLYTYQNNNQYEERLVQDWIGSMWVDRRRSLVEYEAGAVIEGILQAPSNDEWLNRSRWTYEYNLNGNEVNYVFERWSSSPSSVAISAVSPHAAKLKAPFPNPFNPSVTIQYELLKQMVVSLTIYDIRGQTIRTLVNSPQPIGQYQMSWNGIDNQERQVPAGMYFARLQAGEASQVVKMVYIR